MWDCTIEPLADHAQRYITRRNGAVVSYREVMGL
jgi:hypothetical protein